MVAKQTVNMDAVRLMKELRVNYEQEEDFLPREAGLNLIVSAQQVRNASSQ